MGGIAQPICELQHEGLIDKIADTQDFDTAAIEDIKTNPNHYEITTSQYADPFNKGAYVNKLDFVILGALEVDTKFNVNVVVGSDGVITGGTGRSSGYGCRVLNAPSSLRLCFKAAALQSARNARPSRRRVRPLTLLSPITALPSTRNVRTSLKLPKTAICRSAPLKSFATKLTPWLANPTPSSLMTALSVSSKPVTAPSWMLSAK